MFARKSRNTYRSPYRRSDGGKILRLFLLQFCLRLIYPRLKLIFKRGVFLNCALPVGNGLLVIPSDEIQHSLVKKVANRFWLNKLNSFFAILHGTGNIS